MSLFSLIRPAFAHSRIGADEHPTPRLPAYNVQEADECYTLTASLPGVTKDNLSITAENGILTVTGKRTWQKPEGWTPLHLESVGGDFSLTLSYEDAVNADKIAAALTDGVLRLTLPKSEARKPRKIEVR